MAFRWRVPYCQGMVPFSIAQAVFDMVSGGPGSVGSGPAMQAVVRPVYEETLVRCRLKGKIEYACENQNQDYTKDKYPEMLLT